MGKTRGHLDRTGIARHRKTLKGVAAWRLAAGVAVLLALAGFCILLAHPYLQNWKLQSYVEQLAFEQIRAPTPPEVVAATVANRAAQLGIPVHVDQIRVTKSAAGTYIEARYSVRVDMLFYTVDLHFRPSAGVR